MSQLIRRKDWYEGTTIPTLDSIDRGLSTRLEEQNISNWYLSNLIFTPFEGIWRSFNPDLFGLPSFLTPQTINFLNIEIKKYLTRVFSNSLGFDVDQLTEIELFTYLLTVMDPCSGFNFSLRGEVQEMGSRVTSNINATIINFFVSILFDKVRYGDWLQDMHIVGHNLCIYDESGKFKQWPIPLQISTEEVFKNTNVLSVFPQDFYLWQITQRDNPVCIEKDDGSASLGYIFDGEQILSGELTDRLKKLYNNYGMFSYCFYDVQGHLCIDQRRLKDAIQQLNFDQAKQKPIEVSFKEKYTTLAIKAALLKNQHPECLDYLKSLFKSDV